MLAEHSPALQHVRVHRPGAEPLPERERLRHRADIHLARRLLRQPDAAGRASLASVVLVEGDRVFTQSTAALRIARGLGLPWRLAYGLIAVPRPLRDWVYDVVARHRYQWFGQRDACLVPTPQVRARFLD